MLCHDLNSQISLPSTPRAQPVFRASRLHEIKFDQDFYRSGTERPVTQPYVIRAHSRFALHNNIEWRPLRDGRGAVS